MRDKFCAMRCVLSCAILIAVLVLAATRPAEASFALSEVVIDFSPGQPQRRDINVTNTGQDTIYLLMTVSEIVDPDGPNQERLELTNPMKAGLLASPNRMILTPGERKAIRLIVLQPANETDRIYRITVVPQVGELESEEEGMGVKILVGYEMLVIVRPPNAESDLKITRVGRTLNFHNQGSSNTLVRQIQQCRGEGDCQDIPGNRLYAGEKWSVELPMDGPAEVYESFANLNSVSTY